MKHSVFTVALEDMTYEELAPILAEEGYDGVEWRITHPSEDDEMKHLNLHNIKEQAQKVKKLCDGLGLEIPVLASYETMDRLDRIEKLFQLAKLLGARLVRVNPRLYDHVPDFDVRFRDVIDDLRRTITIAKEYRVKPILELHMGTIFPGPSDARRIIDNFSPDEVGITLDPGNMVIEGMIDWELGIQILGEFLVHVHVKNTGWVRQENRMWKWEWMSLREGMVDWAKVINCLKKTGYEGYLSQEDFYSFKCRPEECTPEKKTERIENVRKTLRQNREFLDRLLQIG